MFEQAKGRTSWVMRLCAALCAALVFFAAAPPVAVHAETPEERYERLKGELDTLAGEISAAENDVAQAAALRVSLQQEKSVIDELIAINQQEIEETRAALDEKNEQIAEKREAILETEELFGQRLVAIYKMNNANALTSILSVNSFTEFLQMIDAMRRISKNDSELMDRMEKQRKELEEEQAEIDALLEKLNTTYEELSGNASSLASNIRAQEGEISEGEAELQANREVYGATAEEAEQAYQEMMSASNAVAGMGSSPGEGIPGVEPTPAPAPDPVPEPTPQPDPEPTTSIGENGEEVIVDPPAEPQPDPVPEETPPAVDPAPPEPVMGAVHLWPVPSSRRITCHFGESDPAGRPHTGTDIAAPYNTPIVAAGNGTVILATSHPSYGNYLIIDHGNGLKTLYAHCNSLLVGVGTYVDAGTTVALMGSTGFSTGSHLHFEVHDPGRQNPLGYVS